MLCSMQNYCYFFSTRYLSTVFRSILQYQCFQYLNWLCISVIWLGLKSEISSTDDVWYSYKCYAVLRFIFFSFSIFSSVPVCGLHSLYCYSAVSEPTFYSTLFILPCWMSNHAPSDGAWPYFAIVCITMHCRKLRWYSAIPKTIFCSTHAHIM